MQVAHLRQGVSGRGEGQDETGANFGGHHIGEGRGLRLCMQKPVHVVLMGAAAHASLADGRPELQIRAVLMRRVAEGTQYQ